MRPKHAMPISTSADRSQFVTIVAGTAIAGGEVRRRWDSHFVAPDEPPVALSAGDEGVQFLMMQLPHRAAEYG